jgi:hypothetical protein
MQGGRANIGSRSVPMSGRNATRMSSTPTPKPATYKPNEYGKPDAPGSGPKPVPQPQATRHQPAAAPRRTGSAELANVDSAGLVEAGKQTTGGQPVQQQAPALNNANSSV